MRPIQQDDIQDELNKVMPQWWHYLNEVKGLCQVKAPNKKEAIAEFKRVYNIKLKRPEVNHGRYHHKPKSLSYKEKTD